MRDVAVVATAHRQVPALTGTTEVQLLVPLITAVRDAAGLDQADIGFTCSGSSDFLAGQAFSFVHTLDAVGAVALYEAWVKIQTGEVDTALVYSYGKSSPGSRRDVLATQLDPYLVTPLWPDAHAVAALQARLLLDGGLTSPTALAEIAIRSQRNAVDNPQAVRSSADAGVDELLAEGFVADPLRPSDIAAEADGGCAVILAAGDRARTLCDRPAWIRGIDHRIDAHGLGVRDLTRAPSVALAAERVGVGADRLDVAELHGPYTSQEAVLERELGLQPDTVVNPSGGALAADVLMASGLVRIAEAANRIGAGTADRALAHATSGPCLQQNLLCVLEGD